MHSAVSQSCSPEVDVQIFGIVTDTVIAGRLEICVGGVRRAVYDRSWGTEEVAVVCRDRGFPPEGSKYYFRHTKKPIQWPALVQVPWLAEVRVWEQAHTHLESVTSILVTDVQHSSTAEEYLLMGIFLL